jgi:hypothetical protein
MNTDKTTNHGDTGDTEVPREILFLPWQANAKMILIPGASLCALCLCGSIFDICVYPRSSAVK